MKIWSGQADFSRKVDGELQNYFNAAVLEAFSNETSATFIPNIILQQNFKLPHLKDTTTLEA